MSCCAPFRFGFHLHPSNDLSETTQVLNLGCGRLPKIAAVMVVSNGVLELEVPASQKDMEALVRKQLQELDDTNWSLPIILKLHSCQ